MRGRAVGSRRDERAVRRQLQGRPRAARGPLGALESPSMATPVDRPPLGAADGSNVGSHGQLKVFARRIALLGAMVAGLLAVGTVGLAVTESVGPWYAFRWSL